MTPQLVFDGSVADQLEALYRTQDAERRRRIVRGALAAAQGERILDVGCGPGFYCAEIAEEVGPGGSVTGIDESPAMLALAERRCRGYAGVRLLEGDATALPVPDSDADGAISVQVLEYVPDIPAALGELHRALRPRGRVVIYDIDWATVSVHSERPELTARVLRAWDEHLAHRALPRTLAAQLRAVGFEDVRAEAHAFATTEWDPERYFPVLIRLVADFVPGRQGLTEADGRAWAEEQRELGRRGAFYASTTQFCFTARRP
jgi:arsenite methyltransferase